MSKAEIVETGYRWYKVQVTFSPEEIARAETDILRFAGAQLRYAADGGLTAAFSFRAADPKGGEALVRLLAFFGEKGFFDEGRAVRTLFPGARLESEPLLAAAWREHASRLLAWQDEAVSIVRGCLNAKRSRIETLRAVRSALGAGMSESEVRHIMLEELRRRYRSEIFCATVLQRLGWQRVTPAAAAGTEDAAPALRRIS